MDTLHEEIFMIHIHGSCWFTVSPLRNISVFHYMLDSKDVFPLTIQTYLVVLRSVLIFFIKTEFSISSLMLSSLLLKK